MSGHASKVAQFRQSQNLDHHILTFGTSSFISPTHLDSIEFVSIDYNFPFYRFDGVWCVIQILRLKNMLKWLSVTVQIFEHGFTNIWFLEHKRSRRSLCLGIEGWQTWKFGKWGLQLGMLVIQAVILVDIPEFGKIQDFVKRNSKNTWFTHL